MCMSRYFRVLDADGDTAVLAEDVDGRRHRLALIAYDGSPPPRGTWIVAHAGYALAPAEPGDVALAIGELRHVGDADNRRPTATQISKEAS